MAEMLSTAVSALRAFRRQLDVTSHNIANASTPGYSRQRVDMTTREPQLMGNGYVGSGVQVTGIARYYDDLLSMQLRDSTSAYSRLEIYSSKAAVLNNLFADSSTGLSASLQRFLNAVQGVANEPSSSAARQVMLSEAQSLTQRLQTYDARLNELDAEINARLKGEVADISAAAENIAQLNEKIAAALATTGQPPNDLLDERDRQLSVLSQHVKVSVVKQDDGAWNVFIGNGQSLVLGNQAARLVTYEDPFGSGRLGVAYQSASGAIAPIDAAISGGSLGGIMDFRREMLDPARNQLGQIAIGIASAANLQHHKGVDLTGAMGGDLFGIGEAVVQGKEGNGGSGSVTVSRTDLGALTPYDYVLEYTGSAWSLRRADTGEAVPMTGSGTAGAPFQAAGLSIVTTGYAPAAGDQFMIRPTAGAIEKFSVLISDPTKIAAAAPIIASASGTNSGTGTITAGEVLDASDPATLRSTVNIVFTSPTTYSIDGGVTNLPYTPGGAIEVNGWRVRIDGVPATGDTFTVKSNVGGVGDNRNALALSDMLGQRLLSGGAESLNDAVTRFVGEIGASSNRANVSAEAQRIMREDAAAAMDGVSGVNLDEEAANILRFQQAYQAAAQIIAISQTLFDTLLAATRR